MNNRKKKASKLTNKTFDSIIPKKEEPSLNKLNLSKINMISQLKQIPNNSFFHRRETMTFLESKETKKEQIKNQEKKNLKPKKINNYYNNFSYTIPPKNPKKIPSIKRIEKKVLVKYSPYDGAIENLFGESSSTIVETIKNPKIKKKKDDGKLSRYLMKTPPPILNKQLVKKTFFGNEMENNKSVNNHNKNNNDKIKSKSTDISFEDENRATANFNTAPTYLSNNSVINSKNNYNNEKNNFSKGGVVNLNLNKNRRKILDKDIIKNEDKIISIQKCFRYFFYKKKIKEVKLKGKKIDKFVNMINEIFKKDKKNFFKEMINKRNNHIIQNIKRNLNYYKPSLEKNINENSKSLNLINNFFLPENKKNKIKKTNSQKKIKNKKLDFYRKIIDNNIYSSFSFLEISQNNIININSEIKKKEKNNLIIKENDFSIKSNKISSFKDIEIDLPEEGEFTYEPLSSKISSFRNIEIDFSENFDIINFKLSKFNFNEINKENNFYIKSNKDSSFKNIIIDLNNKLLFNYQGFNNQKYLLNLFYIDKNINFEIKGNNNLKNNIENIFSSFKDIKIYLNENLELINKNNKYKFIEVDKNKNNFEIKSNKKQNLFSEIKIDFPEKLELINKPIKKHYEINSSIDFHLYGNKKKYFSWVKLPIILMKIINKNLYNENSKKFIYQLKTNKKVEKIKENLLKKLKKEDLKILKYYFEKLKLKTRKNKKDKNNKLKEKQKSKETLKPIKKKLTLKKELEKEKIKKKKSLTKKFENTLKIIKEINFEIEKEYYIPNFLSDSFEEEINDNKSINTMNNSFEENRKNIKNLKLESIPKKKKLYKILFRNKTKSKFRIKKNLERNERKRNRKLHFVNRNNESLNNTMRYKQIRIVKKFFDDITGNIIEIPFNGNYLTERGYDSFIEEKNLVDILLKEDKNQKVKRLIMYNLFRQYFRFWKYVTLKKKKQKKKKPRFYDIITIIMKCLFTNNIYVKNAFMGEIYFIKGRYLFKWYWIVFGDVRKKEKEHLKKNKELLKKKK